MLLLCCCCCGAAAGAELLLLLLLCAGRLAVLCLQLMLVVWLQVCVPAQAGKGFDLQRRLWWPGACRCHWSLQLTDTSANNQVN
jgi:hypothetical protein